MKSRQRGVATLAILALISLASFGMSLAPKAYTGTFQFVPAGDSVLKIDTRTGTVENCALVGNTLTCKPVVAGDPAKQITPQVAQQ